MIDGRILGRVALLALLGSQAEAIIADPTSDAPADVEAFLGRWDLTLKTPEREFASWLELTRDNGKLQARMVGRWGHARWLPVAELVDGRLRLVSPKEEEGRTDTDMIFEGRLLGQSLAGKTSGPDGTVWTWRGERAPTLDRAQPPRWEKPRALFNGRDLSGWRVGD